MRSIKELKIFRREQNSTNAEKHFKWALKKVGIKFKKNLPLDRFVIDFWFADRLLVVEIDGSSHDNKKEYDDYRQKRIEEYGLKVLRFTNDMIFKDIWFCVEQVLHEPKSELKYKESLKILSFANSSGRKN